MGSFRTYVEGQSVQIEKHANCSHTIGTIEIIDQLSKMPTHIRCKQCNRTGMTIYQAPSPTKKYVYPL